MHSSTDHLLQSDFCNALLIYFYVYCNSANSIKCFLLLLLAQLIKSYLYFTPNQTHFNLIIFKPSKVGTIKRVDLIVKVINVSKKFN